LKKRVKKLALHRETLVQLAQNDLGYVAGGVTNPPDCEFSNRNTCATCNLTCTTNLC
jgi:hypothetical protein